MRRGYGRAVNVTDGALLRPMLVLSLPIIATNLMQVGYNLADTFWVGRLGQAAVSALSFSWALVFLRIVGLTFAFLGAFRIVQGGFRGSGSTQTAMALSILALLVFRVPPAYALVTWFDMGATGVWWGIAFSNVAILVVAVGWFLRGTWTEAVVDEAPGPGGVDPGMADEVDDREVGSDTEVVPEDD